MEAQPVISDREFESTEAGVRPSVVDAILKGLKVYRESIAFIPSIIAAAAIGICFYRLWMPLYLLWTSADGYYSHGFLVPVISGVIIFKWWPKLKTIPVKPFYVAAIPMLICLWMAKVGSFMLIEGVMSAALIGTLLSAVWLVAGGRWMIGLAAPILYLVFGLPLWNAIINDYTNPLQLASTSVAYEILSLSNFDPLKTAGEPTFIYLNNYTASSFWSR
jgi:Transmembrane exosortase (Exosortase_EpsH)